MALSPVLVPASQCPWGKRGGLYLRSSPVTPLRLQQLAPLWPEERRLGGRGQELRLCRELAVKGERGPRRRVAVHGGSAAPGLRIGEGGCFL